MRFYPHFKTFTSHSLYTRLKTATLALLFGFQVIDMCI
jgi:hypothetical protein